MFNKILVPVDGSKHSKKALNMACELCQAYDGKLYLIHVVQSVPESRTLVLGSSRVTFSTSQEELEKAGSKVIEAAKEIAAKKKCKVASTKITSGSPAMHILRYAAKQKPDVIVMGSRGLSDVKSLLVGSVSHKINHLAECTCITVR